MVLEEFLVENIGPISYVGVIILVIIAMALRKYLPVFFTIIRDGDIDASDIQLILAQFDTTKLAPIAKKLQALDVDVVDLEGFYNLAKMKPEEFGVLLEAMYELGAVEASERDTIVKLLKDGHAKDMDFIFEEVDVEAIKALCIAFKQLNMTQFLTAKDPTPEMKERLYQVVKTSLSKNTSDLNALQKVLV